MQFEEIIEKFKKLESPRNAEGMARFGIRPKTKVCGIPTPELRKLAKVIKKDHKLALKLWLSKIHEARVLASMVADPGMLSLKQIEEWVKDFDSWDVCDQTCMNLFDKSEVAVKQIKKFAESKAEFVRRTAFALMAALASHNEEMSDNDFVKFFPMIKKAANDERNFVKKAVNWALRGIGKRNMSLNKRAIAFAKEIEKDNSKSAQWIAKDAIRELSSQKVAKRLKK